MVSIGAANSCKIRQVQHDVRDQLGELTSISVQTNSHNSETKTIFQKMATAHVFRDLHSA